MSKPDKLTQLWNDVEASQRILKKLDESVQAYDNHQKKQKQESYDKWLLKNQKSTQNQTDLYQSMPTDTLRAQSASHLKSNNQCRNTLPAQSWAYHNDDDFKVQLLNRTSVRMKNSSNKSSIVLDDFNVTTGKEITDKEMPRGKRIKPVLS